VQASTGLDAAEAYRHLADLILTSLSKD